MITTKNVSEVMRKSIADIQAKIEAANDILRYCEESHLTHAEKNGLIKYACLQLAMCNLSILDMTKQSEYIQSRDFVLEPEDLPF